MANLTSQLLPRLQEHQLPGFNLHGDFIYPRYDGQSILNIPASLCQWLGAPPINGTPLLPEIHQAVGAGYRNVVLILMDALALHRFKRWLDTGLALVWQPLVERGTLAPLTSVVPSTTSTALTTLWTGASPAAHGVAGYEVWLKEYGLIANMILHRPSTYAGGTGSLSQAGFVPEDFLNQPTLGPHLADHGIQTHAFQHYTIAHSGLSRMFMPGAQVHSFGSAPDLWVSIRQLLEGNTHERKYTWAYWSGVDTFSHRYGPEDERVWGEFNTFSAALKHHFLDQLSSEVRRDTLLILTADHGMIDTPLTPRYQYLQHPELARMLPMVPTGENRMMYLFSKSGQTASVRDYFETTWPGDFSVFDPAAAVKAGLFGPGQPHPQLAERLGDLAATPNRQAYLWWADKPDFLLGRHGGLTPEEMLVPFVAVPL